MLRFTTYGRSIYAVGGNPEAARLSGLNTTGLIMSVYVISGFLAGLCGFLADVPARRGRGRRRARDTN